MELMPDTRLDFEELTKIRRKCNKQLRCYLENMNKTWFRNVDQYLDEPEFSIRSHVSFDVHAICSNYIHVDDKSLNILIHENNNKHPMNYHFLLDELINLLQKSQR
jgi:hypothetical protein